uniref:Acetylajmalan esterase n=1 Tax=Lygus hesperus TaxID=30085 RepID=A0A0A9VTI2_LYGHE
MSGSVAYNETGKVINPAEGICYGTSTTRGWDGTYRHDTQRAFRDSTKHVLPGSVQQITCTRDHPYGAGLTFPAIPSLISGSSAMSAKTHSNHCDRGGRNKSTYETKGNKLVQIETPSEVMTNGSTAANQSIVYPGSVYNTYMNACVNTASTRNMTDTVNTKANGQKAR